LSKTTDQIDLHLFARIKEKEPVFFFSVDLYLASDNLSERISQQLDLFFFIYYYSYYPLDEIANFSA
jgi:hypothetical protein